MKLLATLLFALVGAPLFAGTVSAPSTLSSESPPTVYARMGMITSVTVKSEEPLKAVIKGGPEINVQLQGEIINIQPLIPNGLTTVSFTVEGVSYVIKVRIIEGDPESLNPVFSIKKEGAFSSLDAPLGRSKPLKPSEVDLNGAIRTIEQAEFDEAFASRLKNFASIDLRKVYQWNGCEIHFLKAYQFADLDMIVFKASWVNTRTQAYYLNAKQYGITVSGRNIPIIQRRQLAPRSIVFPGQLEQVWLCVQGYKLRLDNPWELTLPADAAQLRAFTPVTK